MSSRRRQSSTTAASTPASASRHRLQSNVGTAPRPGRAAPAALQTNTTTPARSTVTKLPPYETPRFSFTAKAQGALGDVLSDMMTTKKVRDFLDNSNACITDAAADANDALTELKMENKSRAERRAKAAAAAEAAAAREAEASDDENDADTVAAKRAAAEAREAAARARGEQEAKDVARLEEITRKVETLTRRLDASVRKIIDSEARLKHMDDAMKDVQAEAEASSQAQAAFAASQQQVASQAQQQQAQSQRSRRPNLASSSDEDEAEADGDDLVTLPPTNPASTAGPPPQAPPIPSLHALLTRTLTDKHDAYTALLPIKRYGDAQKYVDFKKLVHDASYPASLAQQPPLPPKASWFREPGAGPAPGVTPSNAASAHTSSTTLGGDGDGDGDDASGSSDDDDMAVAAERVSTRCPISRLEFSDPLTSRKCPHSFERAYIHQYLQSGGAGGAGAGVQCPVSGCEQVLTPADLVEDQVLVRRIKRIQRARELAREAEEEEAREQAREKGKGKGKGKGRGRDGDGESIESSSGEEDVDEIAARSVRGPGGKRRKVASVKRERLSGRPSGGVGGGAAPAGDEEMEDIENSEDE